MMKDFKEMLSAELISITGGLIAGTILAFETNRLELIPGILILLPGFLEMRGNISGSLSARLASGLFLGALKPKIGKDRILLGNVVASIVLVILLSLILGFVVYLGSYYFFGISSMKIILVALVAGILSNFIEVPVAIVTTFWLFRHGHDPNNIMGPYITTVGDIVSIFSLLIAIAII